MKNIIIVIIFFTFTSIHSFELKTLAQSNAAPKFISTGDKVEGLCVEIMYAIEEEDREIKFIGYQSYAPFARQLVELSSGGIDVIVGIVKNEERSGKYTFIDIPIYTTNHILAARVGDEVTINSFEDIRKLGSEGVILTNHGAAHVQFLETQGGLLLDYGANNTPANLLKLLHNRGRFFYMNDIETMYDIKQQGLNKKIKILNTSFAKFPHYIAFSKKTPIEQVRKVESVIKLLDQKGTFKKIFSKYTTY